MRNKWVSFWATLCVVVGFVAVFFLVRRILVIENTIPNAQAVAMTQVQPAWPSNEQLALPVKDIHKVVLFFQDGKQGEFLVPKDELEHFLTASIRLHHNPGINPHNQAKTAPLKSISVAYPTLEGPFWWTTPSLQLQEKELGARIISWTFYKIWTPEKSWIDESGSMRKAI